MRRRIPDSEKTSLEKAMQSESVEVIRSALENGATANYFDYDLHGNHYYALTEFLLDKCNRNISENDLEIVKLLLEHKAHLYWEDKYGNRPLDLALRCKGENKDKLLVILKEAGLDFNKENLTSTVSKSGTSLGVAIRTGHEEGVSSLLKHNASVHKTSCGKTPLQIAAQRQSMPLAKMLLDAKAEVDYIVDSFPGWISEPAQTPLHIAVGNEQREMVDLLLASKVNPNAYDKRRTPLLTAAYQNSSSLIACLLQHGANPFMANNSEWDTPLHSYHKEVVATIKQSPIFKENTKKLIDAGFFSSEPNENIISVTSPPFVTSMKEGKYYKQNRGEKGARVYWLENHHKCLQDFSKAVMDKIDMYWDLPTLVEVEEPAPRLTAGVKRPR